MTITNTENPTSDSPIIQSTLITDPTLQDCLTLASKIRTLCHQILTTIHSNNANNLLHQNSTADDMNPSITLTDDPDPSVSPITHLSESQRTTLSNHQRLLSAYLTQLKILHRNAYMSIREAKSLTGEKRSEVDRLHLQLQNLYYEQRHLRGEINAAREFPHKYTSLPLIPISEYLSIHPEQADTPSHDLMIARLNDEKAAREQLEKKRKELLLKKQNLILENKKRKDELAGLDDMLKKFIESSRSIQRTFEKDY